MYVIHTNHGAAVDSKAVMKVLRKAGWVHVATRGDHHKFRDPRSGRTTTVQHPRRDIPIGTPLAIERQTGLRLR